MTSCRKRRVVGKGEEIRRRFTDVIRDDIGVTRCPTDVQAFVGHALVSWPREEF